MKRYIGLDIHKKYGYAAFLSQEGEIKTHRFPMNGKGLDYLSQRLKPEDELVMEATGNCFHLYDLLKDNCSRVLVANPHQLRAIAQARVKTDKISSILMAKLLAADFIPEVWVPSKEAREMRSLLRYRVSLSKTKTIFKNKIHSLLLRKGISFSGSDLFGKKGRDFLSDLDLSLTERIQLSSALSILDAVEEEISKLEGELARRAQNDPQIKLLMTIPGIDFYSALIIRWEIGDVDRFPSDKHLSSYSGLVPQVHQSGNIDRHGPITKQGRKLLRWILIQAVQHLVRRKGKMKDFYLRLKRKKGHNVAIVACAHKLLVIIYHMLNRGTPYREEDQPLTARKLAKMKRKAQMYEVDPHRLERLLSPT
jgi:transposase